VLKQGGYEALILPMEHEPTRVVETSIGWKDPRRDEGELLWPARFGPAEVTQLKVELGSFAYGGQYQQRPVPRQGGIIKRSWCQRFWTELPTTTDEWLASWDLSFKESRSSSFVVGQVWARVDSCFYLVDQIWERLTFVESLTAVDAPREEAANLMAGLRGFVWVIFVKFDRPTVAPPQIRVDMPTG
jgi:hypothetical protein